MRWHFCFLVLVLFVITGCSECDNPKHGQCEVVGQITDFQIAMAGTGIGIGSQIYKEATIILEDGTKFVTDNPDIIDNLQTGSYYMKCVPCYGTGWYYNVQR
jgi:hypothetical protein